MIIYFSGTGNSLAVSRQIAGAVGDSVMPLAEAVKHDLSGERRIGLVYPSYWFEAPVAVRCLVPRLRINPDAYVFIIITCGAQAGNSVWSVSRQLRQMGVRVAYCHKIRVPDSSAIGFGRNPNEQSWKFSRYAPRLERIVNDVKSEVHARHYGWWGFAGWLMTRPSLEAKTVKSLTPAVNADLCIGCGTCAKTCPIGNITLTPREGAKPHAHIGAECTTCLSCVHFCPRQAVQVAGRPTLQPNQYHHPDIKARDLFRS